MKDWIDFVVGGTLFFPALIGSVAYLLKGWLDGNKQIRLARVEQAALISKKLMPLLNGLQSQKANQLELALNDIKAEMPHFILFASRTTEEKLLKFFDYTNEAVRVLAEGETLSATQSENVRVNIMNFLNSLRLDVLGWSRYGIWLRCLNWNDRRKHNKAKNRS